MTTIKLLNTLFLMLVFSFLQNVALFGDTGKLMAGTAKVNITPNTKDALHDSLYARSLVLEINGQRIAFVSVDMGIYTNDRLNKICKDRFGISTLLLSSSHTHSSPQNMDKIFLEDRLILVIEEACRNMFPARISAGHRVFPQLGFNRLIVREDGHSRESWYSDDHYTSENPERIPFGPVDPEVGVIKIEDFKGQVRVVMMNYACHADIVCQNYEISADYPGVACRKVEEALGNHANCLFVQGAAGNIESLIISSRRKGKDDPFKSDYGTIERVGGLLAYETVKLVKSMVPVKEENTDFEYKLDSLKFTGRFDKTANFDIHISTILINNNIVIATCPGEPFIQLQLDWKKKVEDASGNPFLFGYTWYKGTWPNYIADIKSAAQGGYGADQDSPVLVEVGAGEAIMNKHFGNYFLLNGLMRNKSGPVGFVPGSQWSIKEIPAKK